MKYSWIPNKLAEQGLQHLEKGNRGTFLEPDLEVGGFPARVWWPVGPPAAGIDIGVGPFASRVAGKAAHCATV